MEVPRSGCRKIRSDGSATMAKAYTKARGFGGKAFLENHHAMASGIVNFITSEG